MNKKVKALLLVLCALVLFASGIFATLAYLQDTTEEVAKNTFTIGDINITLDEAVVDEYGVAADPENNRTATEQKYTVVAGEKYTKDPTIHVAEGSEPAWLYAKVTNGIKELLAADGIEWVEGWTLVDGYTDLYVYANQVNAKTQDQDVTIFKSITFDTDVTNDVATETAYNGKQITVQGFAIQAKGFATALDAKAEAATALIATPVQP